MVHRPTLSEHDSKKLLATYGASFAAEATAQDATAAVQAAARIGYPVVMKLVGERLAHKSERGLVRLGIADDASAAHTARELLAARRDDDGDVTLLVAEQIEGSRELLLGLVRDPVFGPVIVLGAGGVTAEAIADVQMRVAPLHRSDLDDMLDALGTSRLYGSFRGKRPVDRVALWNLVEAVQSLAMDRSDVSSVDINPVIVTDDGRPIAVDALIELRGSTTSPGTQTSGEANTPQTNEPEVPRHDDSGFDALFSPRGVVVVGASTHPGKFGFVSLHNLLVGGYRGQIAATNLSKEIVLGVPTVAAITDLTSNTYDLAFFCTPASVNEQLIRDCAERGIRAVFVTSAGYDESGSEPAAAQTGESGGESPQERLVRIARECDVFLAGPNGQGVVSTPSSLCAQIVAPYPPAGSISIASQSGNFVSSFMNLSRATGVG
ncbi:MAG: acetate--CoA ligase family protein, partial [Ilumatobacteraceae bacterium]